MTKLGKLLRRYDDRDLARHGNRARFLQRLESFMALYTDLLSKETVSSDDAGELLDRLTLVFGNIQDHTCKDLASAIVPVMKAEFSAWRTLRARIGADLHRLRTLSPTSETVGHLKVRAACQMAILREELPFLARFSNAKVAEAKSLYTSAERWLLARYRLENPVTVEYVQTSTGQPYQPVIGTPTYSGL